MFKINSKAFFLIFILVPLVLAIYNFYNFEINIFGDRDLVRSQNIFSFFEVYGYEFGMQNGRRIPGGFYYYYLGLIELLSSNVLIKNYISSFFSIISFIFLFKLNKETFNKSDLIISLFFFLTSTCFLQQTKILWNPSFGLPFSILGIAYFINYFGNNKKLILFVSFVFIFLAAQFHISYMSFILVFAVILILLKRFKFVSHLSLILLSFTLCYLPYLINLFYPIINIENNSYHIVQESSAIYEKDFNIFVWFFKNQLHKANLFLSILSEITFLSKKIIILISIMILILFFYVAFKLLNNKKLNLKNLILNRKILILSLIIIYFIYVLLSFHSPAVIFVIPTFLLISLIVLINSRKENKFFLNLNLDNKFYLITYLYLLIFFVTNLGYFFTYNQPTNIINGSNRFTLGLLPVYAILSGTCVSILLSEKSIFPNYKNKIFLFLIASLVLFQISNSSLFIFKERHEDKINSFKAQKEVINNLNNIYDLNKTNFLTKVGFLRYSEDKIVPIEKIGLSYYINKKFSNINDNKFSNCIAVVFNSKDKIDRLNINIKLDEFFNNIREGVIIKNVKKFSNYYIFEYKDKNNFCINNLSNDYILSSDEKEIEKFLLNKQNSKSYRIKKDNFIKYYFNLSNKNFILPINSMLRVEILDNQLNLKLFSKVLRNSSSKLNGFWDEVNFYQPKFVFKNLENFKEYNFQTTKDIVGNDIYKSPVNFSNIQIPQGNYEIILEVKKINSLFMNKELNDIKLTLDKNFKLSYLK